MMVRLRCLRRRRLLQLTVGAILLCLACTLLLQFESSKLDWLTGSFKSKSGHPVRPQRKGKGGMNLGVLYREFANPVSCQHPRFSLEQDSIGDKFPQRPPLECDAENSIFTLIDSGGKKVLVLDENKLDASQLDRCQLSHVTRVDDETHGMQQVEQAERSPWKLEKLDADFVYVSCFRKQGNKLDGVGDVKMVADDRNAPEDEERRSPVAAVDTPKAVTGVAAAAAAAMTQADQSYNLVDSDDVETKIVVEEEDEDEQNAGDDDEPDDVFEEPDYEQFFVQIVPNKDYFAHAKFIDISPHLSSLDVLILALDSLSHMSWQRMLPKTYKTLKDLHAFTMDGYNIIGDATTAAMLPILTGKTEEELPEARRGQPDADSVSEFSGLIWNKFEHEGYVTMFAEDEPTLGMFNLRLTGFEHPPTHHYMRPFWQAAWASPLQENSKRFCLGDRPKHSFTLEYVDKFMKSYPGKRKFALAFHGELSHADNSYARYADDDLSRLLLSVSLENTLVVVLSDHGSRYSEVRQSVQGKLEERMPLLSLVVPQSFQDKFPVIQKSLTTNQQRLVTPFDLHETLLDVLDTRRLEQKVDHSKRGMSLFKEIPTNRTCGSAQVESHWCTCLQWKNVSIDDRYVVASAKKLVNSINEMLVPLKDNCSRLDLDQVLSAQMIKPNEALLRYKGSKDKDNRRARLAAQPVQELMDYQVAIRTRPNDALFEAVLRVDTINDRYFVTADISRLDQYTEQPSCIRKWAPFLEKFCHCQ